MLRLRFYKAKILQGHCLERADGLKEVQVTIVDSMCLTKKYSARSLSWELEALKRFRDNLQTDLFIGCLQRCSWLLAYPSTQQIPLNPLYPWVLGQVRLYEDNHSIALATGAYKVANLLQKSKGSDQLSYFMILHSESRRSQKQGRPCHLHTEGNIIHT